MKNNNETLNININGQTFINNFESVMRVYGIIGEAISNNDIDTLEDLTSTQKDAIVLLKDLFENESTREYLELNLVDNNKIRKVHRFIDFETRNNNIGKYYEIIKQSTTKTEIISSNGIIIPVDYNLRSAEEIQRNIKEIEQEFNNKDIDPTMSKELIMLLKNKYSNRNKIIPIIEYWGLLKYLKTLLKKDDSTLEKHGVFLLSQKHKVDIEYTDSYKDILQTQKLTKKSNYTIFMFTKNLKKTGQIKNEIFKLTSIFEKTPHKGLNKCISKLKDIQDFSMQLSIILEGLKTQDNNFIYQNTINPFDNAIKIAHVGLDNNQNLQTQLSNMFGYSYQEHIGSFTEFFNKVIEKHGVKKLQNDTAYIESSFSDILFIMVNNNILCDSIDTITTQSWKIFINTKTQSIIENKINNEFDNKHFVKEYKRKTKKSTKKLKNILSQAIQSVFSRGTAHFSYQNYFTVEIHKEKVLMSATMLKNTVSFFLDIIEEINKENSKKLFHIDKKQKYIIKI